MLSSVSSMCQMCRHLMKLYFTSSQDSVRGGSRIGREGDLEVAGAVEACVVVGPAVVLLASVDGVFGFADSACCLGWLTDWKGSRINCRQGINSQVCNKTNQRTLQLPGHYNVQNICRVIPSTVKRGVELQSEHR